MYDSMMPGVFSSLLSLAIFVAIFLLLRALWLWYFRINEIVHLLDWQKNLLETQHEQNKRVITLLEQIAGQKPEDNTGGTRIGDA